MSVVLSLLQLLIRPGGYSGSGVGSIDAQSHCMYGQPSLDQMVWDNLSHHMSAGLSVVMATLL